MDLSRRLYTCRFCESIAVFRDGSAVQNGTTHDGLVSDADGKYYRMWSAQTQYFE